MARKRAEAQAKLDAYKQGGGTVPSGALLYDDPRLQAGGGPHGMSNEYTDSGHGYWTYQEPKTLPPGWVGGDLTPQGANNPYLRQQQYAGHAQYDPRLWAQYIQSHPNATGFQGIGGLPEDIRQQWLAAQGKKMWQEAVVKQHAQPNNGQAPMPQGGLAVTTPGIPAGDSKYWIDQARKYYSDMEKPYLKPKAAAPAAPQRPTTPAKSPISMQQQTSLQQDLAGRKGAKPGATFTKDGRTYTMNPKGAWVDTTDPNKRVRVTDRGGGFLTDKDRAANVAAGNKKAAEKKPAPGKSNAPNLTPQEKEQRKKIFGGGH